jgi:hypothetical protein
MTTVVVGGALANKRLNGGEAWVRLSWVRGLRRLGFDVRLWEQIDAGACVDADGRPATFGESANLAYFRDVTTAFGLDGQAVLMTADGAHVHGGELDELRDVAAEAELLVNISGNLAFAPLLSRFRRRAYVDIDPGFTQFWHQRGLLGAQLDDHDHHFTIGENIGRPDCPIPSAGIRWRPLRQPVVLDDWPAAGGAADAGFTTVASWRGPYGPVEHDGRRYGLKAHEFRKVMELPRRVPRDFEIALSIDAGDAPDVERLRAHGWRLADPLATASDPGRFRRYVQRSGAEFSVAQGIYVETGSGWFSDRTTRYLAAGKPALVQSTGFERTVPVGEGLLAFRTLEEAEREARRLTADYERHARAARAIAESHFDSDAVLGRLLEDVGAAP